MATRKNPPPAKPLPNLVDDLLSAANALKFHARSLTAWHARFQDPGNHLADGPLTIHEQLHLDVLLSSVRHADERYVTAHDNFVAARSAAAARQRDR